MSRRPRESWLGSSDHEKFAALMMLCQSGAPWECSESRKCWRDGECFTTERQGACAAWRMIRRLESENVVVQRHLDRAVKFLRYGEAETKGLFDEHR